MTETFTTVAAGDVFALSAEAHAVMDGRPLFAGATDNVALRVTDVRAPGGLLAVLAGLPQIVWPTDEVVIAEATDPRAGFIIVPWTWLERVPS